MARLTLITADQARDILDLAPRLSVTDEGKFSVAELQQIAQEADITAEYLEQAIAQYTQAKNLKRPNQVHNAVRQEVKPLDSTRPKKHKRSSLVKKQILAVFVGLFGISGFLGLVPCYYTFSQLEYQGVSHMLIQSAFDVIKLMLVLNLSLQLVLVSVPTWHDEEELRPQVSLSL